MLVALSLLYMFITVIGRGKSPEKALVVTLIRAVVRGG